MKVIKHFRTITKHRHKVMSHCFKVGLVWQGLTHDLSKYSPAEFIPGAKYYQGNRSPQSKERELFGYSAAWLHHKGRNKHHFEYWTDFADGRKVYVEMPPKYLAEMICDRVAACKIYLKENYTDQSALDYFEKRTDKSGMNEKTAEMLRYFLALLAERGEKEMFKELKQYVKESKASRHEK
jgi:hypothetical protein